mgnify:FL=1
MFLFKKDDWPAWSDKKPEKNCLCIGITKRTGNTFYFVIMDGWGGVIVKISGNGTLSSSSRPPMCWRYASELGIKLDGQLPKRGSQLKMDKHG